MAENTPPVRLDYRTHYMDVPEKREGHDRRRVSCFIGKDRRCGVACRRQERQRETARRIALKKVRFYPEYFKMA